MSLVQPVEDGKFVANGSKTESVSKTGFNQGGGALDKEAFLQLLVAQMKYQDPLQPTSNTEYIAQFAQFSQVESLQNLSGSMDLQRASALVGKDVWVQTTNASGESSYVQGRVDYVTYEGGKAYVYINEQAYPLEEVQTIVDPQYQVAYDKALSLVTGINKLPNVGAVDLTDAEMVDALEKLYNEMNDYEKSFVAKEKVDALQAYVEKIAELRKLAEDDEVKPPTEDGGDDDKNPGGDGGEE